MAKRGRGGGGGGRTWNRSAAAKKGWETRRRGGAKAKTQPSKPTATAPTKPTKPRATGRTAARPATTSRPAPKTTTARGRARTNATAARQRLRSGGGAKAARSLLIAQRASSFYKAHNTGTKRSPSRGGSAPAKATATRAAAKPSRGRSGAKPATQTTGRRPNLAAQRAKAMANRTGVVPGSRYESGQAQRTLSLREMRTAVRQKARQAGVTTATEFKLMYGLGSGVTAKGASGGATGRMPKTRSDWERIYKSTIGVPQSERGMKARPGVIRGINIHTNFRPAFVFGLKPGYKASDVNTAFKQLARTNHPDVGGRRRDFERLKLMRDSLIAMMPKPKPARASRSRKGSSAPAPSVPRLLPPASGGASKPRRRKR